MNTTAASKTARHPSRMHEADGRTVESLEMPRVLCRLPDLRDAEITEAPTHEPLRQDAAPAVKTAPPAKQSSSPRTNSPGPSSPRSGARSWREKFNLAQHGVPPMAVLGGIVGAAVLMMVVLLRGSAPLPPEAAEKLSPPEVVVETPSRLMVTGANSETSPEPGQAELIGRAMDPPAGGYPQTSTPWPAEYEAKRSEASAVPQAAAEFEGTITNPSYRAQHEHDGSSIH